MSDLFKIITNSLHHKLKETFNKLTYRTVISANDNVKFVSKDVYPPHIQKGIKYDKVYEHQYLGWNILREDKHLCISLPTAAGKSLCYIPYMVDIGKQGLKSIVISPLKELQNDQYNEVNSFLKRAELETSVSVGLVNSDVKVNERVYNPTISFLGEFSLDHFIKNDSIDWKKLKFIVIDEAHSYIGIKGGHLANIILRIIIKCLTYGNTDLQIVAMSATIANPEYLFERLTNGYFPELIKENTAAIGKKDITVTKFPIEWLTVLKALTECEGKSIIFTDNIIKTQDLCLKGNSICGDNKFAYFNSTLDTKKRREIIKKFGDENDPLSIIISTSSLEAGIDLDNVDNVVVDVSKGGLSQVSVQQRLGRCGRGFNSDGSINEGNVLILLPQDSKSPQSIWERPLEYGLPSCSEMLRYIHFTRCIYETVNKKAVLLGKPQGITHYPLKTYLEWFFPDDENAEELVSQKNYNYEIIDFEGQKYPVYKGESPPHRKMLFKPSSSIVVFDYETDRKIGTISENMVKSYYMPQSVVHFNDDFYEVISVTRQRVVLKKSPNKKEIAVAYNFYIVNFYDISDKNKKEWIFNSVKDFEISKPLLKNINISRKIVDNNFNDNYKGHALIMQGDLTYSAANGIIRAVSNLFMKENPIGFYKKDEQFLFYELEEFDDTILDLYTHFGAVIQEALRLTETCDCENGCASCIGYVKGSMMLKTELEKYDTIKWYKTMLHNLKILS